MLVMVLGLLALTQAVVLWTFEQRVERQALQQVQHELLTAERVWLRMAAEQTRVLREGARQLGSDQAFVQAQRGNDQPALVLALERVLSMDEMAGLVALSQDKSTPEQVAV